MTGEIHEGENPFVAPEADRDPIRRFRGRLAAPVTIITAGDASGIAGLTISSIMVAEGSPGSVHFLLGSTADVYGIIQRSDRFVVHVLAHADGGLSDIFAGRRPNPGGPFSGLSFTLGDWGPVLDDVTDRAYCSGVSVSEQGYSLLVSAGVDEVEFTDFTDPLSYFRGMYRSLE